MNMILLTPEDFTSPNAATLTGPRHEHIKNILKAKPHDRLTVGLLNGKLGAGTVVNCSESSSSIFTELTLDPPPAMDITLILAMNRPKMIKRILTSTSMLGVKNIHLIHSFYVEKSYWSSPVLNNKSYENYFFKGLEQSKDTVMPTLKTHKLFKPFIEDKAPHIIKNKSALVAHPYKAEKFNSAKLTTPAVLAVGPERGFTDFEIDKFNQCGFKTISLGHRPLRTEVFIPSFLGQFL